MRKIISVLLFFYTANLLAQDVHFSQFSSNSILLNPAMVALQESTYKASLHRKSQWESVSVPFSTFSLSLERKDVLPLNNIGLQFLNDIAGDSRFKTSGLSIVYSKLININEKNLISLGAGFGIFQRSIFFDDLVFNDPENLTNINFLYPDISIGLANQKIINNQLTLESGVALYHLNKPKQSLLNNDEIRLKQKLNIHAGVKYNINNDWEVYPHFLWSNQSSDKELVIACDAGYNFDRLKDRHLLTGVSMRLKDAATVKAGATFEKLSALILYDINISTLSNASDFKGGFEFVLIYQWGVKKKEKQETEKICPKYI